MKLLSLILSVLIAMQSIAPAMSAQSDQPDQSEQQQDSDTSPDTLPDNCKDLVTSQGFLIAGPMEAQFVGARLWNVPKILREESQGSDNQDCLEKIKAQALSDEKTYWEHIGRKYHCLDDQDNLPDSKPGECAQGKYDAVRLNLRTIHVYESLETQFTSGGSAQGNCGQSQQSILDPKAAQTISLSTEAASQAGNDQGTREPASTTITSDVSQAEIWEPAREESSCRLAAMDEKGMSTGVNSTQNTGLTITSKNTKTTGFPVSALTL